MKSNVGWLNSYQNHKRITTLKQLQLNSTLYSNLFIEYQIQQTAKNKWVWVWVYWCFTSHGTIFQLYMWRHRWAGGLKKKLYLRSGSQRHGHFAGFFNVPVLHRHGTNLFIRWFRHTAPLVAFYDTLGIRRTYSRLKPPASSREAKNKCGRFLQRRNGMMTVIIIMQKYPILRQDSVALAFF